MALRQHCAMPSQLRLFKPFLFLEKRLVANIGLYVRRHHFLWLPYIWGATYNSSVMPYLK